MREHEVLARLGAQLGPSSRRVLTGIGDDAAVLSPGTGNLVVTDDTCVEGVHFTRAIASLEDMGFRATMAAASDLAAMGARPLAAVASLMLPAGTSDRDIDALMAGQAEAARDVGAPIVGGNLTRGPVIAISTTWLGEAAAPVLRSGARGGDGIWLAGPVGLAAAGLHALLHGIDDDVLRRAIAIWRRPRARITEGLSLASHAGSLIDISDGLAADAAHIARASQVTFILDAEAILAAAGEALSLAAARLSLDPLALALAGGEDYALLATSPEDLTAMGFHRIGRVVAGAPDVQIESDGEGIEPPPGFDHFAPRRP